MGTAAAIVGGALIGGAASKSSAGKAAGAQKDAAKQIAAASNRAREDVLTFFPQAQQSLLTGAQGAFDIFGQSIPLQQQQLSQGNLGAQQSTIQGFDEAQRALLGLPQQGFEVKGVEFDEKPFMEGHSLLGQQQAVTTSPGRTVIMPTFQGLGNVMGLQTRSPADTQRNLGFRVRDLSKENQKLRDQLAALGGA